MVDHGDRIQNSYNILKIVLAAKSGWLPAANFTLVLGGLYKTLIKGTLMQI